MMSSLNMQSTKKKTQLGIETERTELRLIWKLLGKKSTYTEQFIKL